MNVVLTVAIALGIMGLIYLISWMAHEILLLRQQSEFLRNTLKEAWVQSGEPEEDGTITLVKMTEEEVDRLIADNLKVCGADGTDSMPGDFNI